MKSFIESVRFIDENPDNSIYIFCTDVDQFHFMNLYHEDNEIVSGETSVYFLLLTAAIQGEI